jgi:adenine-specific DNA-methyltransferase
MKAQNKHQNLPANGPEREALREKGQFWTPDWVADAMVAYVISSRGNNIFDPAVGAGAFFRAARRIEREYRLLLDLYGREVDPDALLEAERSGLSASDLARVEIADFVLNPPPKKYKAIVANPPYIRHHRLTPSVKTQLRAFGAETMGVRLDGRAGLHIYFLIRALQLLEEDGRLAFIMPADTCEGVFAPSLWRWITTNNHVEAVVTFTPESSPFPNVDTNPVIFLIHKSTPKERFQWVQCKQAETKQLKEWMASGLTDIDKGDLYICDREIEEGIATGFSRPLSRVQNGAPVLRDFAKVLRGIATGANEFFFLTREQTRILGIPEDFLKPAIGRTRDVPNDQITLELLRTLDEAGRPTLLFAPDGRTIEMFPPSVREYLLKGQEAGLDKRALITQRQPWYKMESRHIPPFLFAYLGRRNARFIRNLAGVVPLTGFLCVYPNQEDPGFVDMLWKVLNHPQTISNLSLVGKSYGDGAIKVEPRALERLPIPPSVLSEVGIEIKARSQQLALYQLP